MNKVEKKKFLVNAAIKEVKVLSALSQSKCVYSFKIDIPIELELFGNKAIFQELLFHLIKNADKAYENELTNKIILVTSQIENDKELSVSVTHGGKSFSFLEQKLIKPVTFVFREDQKKLGIYQTKHTMKRFFNGYIKVYSKKNKGGTIKCYFPLNQ